MFKIEDLGSSFDMRVPIERINPEFIDLVNTETAKLLARYTHNNQITIREAYSIRRRFLYIVLPRITASLMNKFISGPGRVGVPYQYLLEMIHYFVEDMILNPPSGSVEFESPVY